MVNIYGIPNCGSVKKAFAWLNKNNVKFVFHDFKKEGITEAKLKEWIAAQTLDIVLNKKGTTWKGLTLVAQKKATKEKDAITLMQENTSLIKRPVVELNTTILIGFNADEYAKSFL